MNVEYVCSAQVEGDIVEFGTGQGITASIIAKSLVQYERKPYEEFGMKNFYLFDSFAGLPSISDPSDLDMIHVKSNIWSEGACKGLTKDELMLLLNNWLPSVRLKIFDGWFDKTIKNIEKRVIFSMVHIDCDLYKSAIDVLNYLFAHHHISKGAILLFDDWNCNAASNDHGVRKAWAEMSRKYDVKFSDCGPYGWGGWYFIVHNYSSIN